MSWSLPCALKRKLSISWIKSLEMLANIKFFSFAVGAVLEGKVSNRNEDHSDKEVESWDFVLSILEEEEAVEENGELKLQPVFLSLPSLLQLRFIFFLQSNISRVSTHSIHSFLEKIDSSKNVWMKEAVCQLKNSVARCSTEINQHTRQTITNYAFSAESQNSLQNILSKLKNEKRWSWQQFPASNLVPKKDENEGTIGNIFTLKNTEDSSATSNTSVSVISPVTKNTTLALPKCSETATDIIIIDEDSTDYVTSIKDNSTSMITNNTNNYYKSNVNTLPSDNKYDIEKSVIIGCSDQDKLSSNESSKQIAEKESTVVSNKRSSTEQVDVISDKLDFEDCQHLSVDSNIHRFSVKRKRKCVENLTQIDDVIECPLSEELTSGNKINKVETADDANYTTSTKPNQLALAADSEVMLSENVMLLLDNIRETCSSKENSFVVAKDIMNCFLEMEAVEIKLACTYLGLPNFLEKALVNFCDSIPWASLGNESSISLLDSCFSSKLKELESQASRTLLMSLDSVSRIQPKALITVLVHILQITQSGEFQCQVLTSICKDFLPLDCFGYLVEQLSMEGLVMNEHLVNVLQTLLDKRAELDTNSLSYFHSLLTTGSHTMSSNAKFGKLLMCVLRKFVKMMSSQQFITICAMVESHNSSFRKQLLALVKRCT